MHRTVVKRIRTIPAGLAAFVLVAAIALVSPTGWADNDLNVSIDMKVTVKSDATYEASFVITDTTDASLMAPITEDSCTLNYFLVEENIFADAETKFDNGKDKRVCTITKKGKISETNGAIKHDNDEYTIDTSSMNERKTPSPKLQLHYAATFPGEVTQSDGGTVEGNTVSFTDFTGRVIKGKDRPASEVTVNKTLPWIIGGVGTLVVVGLLLMAAIVRRRQQSRQAAPGPYPQDSPAQGFVPQTPQFGHPVPQQYPVQPYQQHPGQPSPPYSPPGSADEPYPPSTQAPQQHGVWPPPQPQ